MYSPGFKAAEKLSSEQWPDLPNKSQEKPLAAPIIKALHPNTCAQYAICTLVPEISYDELCQSMNPKHQPTAARPMIELLDSKLGATAHNHGKFEDLQEALDRGKKVIAFISSAQNNPHWVVVSGYKANQAGEITAWEIIDTSFSFNQPNGKALLSHQEFTSRWSCPENFASGKYSNYWIEVGKEKSFSDPDTTLAAIQIPKHENIYKEVLKTVDIKEEQNTTLKTQAEEIHQKEKFKSLDAEDIFKPEKTKITLKKLFNEIYNQAKTFFDYLRKNLFS